MQEFDYSIDIIVTKLTLHQKDGQFSGCIKFGEHCIEVPAFSTNNFRCGRSIVVRATSQDLRKRLQSCPIILEIFKERSEKIAEVSIPWPEIAIIRLENPSFSCDSQFECVTFPEGLVALILKVAKVQMVHRTPLDRTDLVESLTESDDLNEPEDEHVSTRFATKNYKIINGRVVRVNSVHCLQLTPEVCPKLDRPLTSGLETHRANMPKTCHELFGNRLASEKCHLCQEHLLTAKGPLCDSCGGVSVNTKMADQMKLFDHHLCVQDCPMDPVAKKFQSEVQSPCSSDSPVKDACLKRPICCDCCGKSDGICEKCLIKRKSPSKQTKRIRLSRTTKQSKLITLTNKDGQKKKYRIEVEFVHTAKKGAKRCAKEMERNRRVPCRPSMRMENLKSSAQYTDQIYGPKLGSFIDSSNDNFETSKKRVAREKSEKKTVRKSRTRKSIANGDSLTETSEESSEKQANVGVSTRKSKLKASKSKKKSKRRSSDSDESQTTNLKSSKCKKKSKQRSSDTDESQQDKLKSSKSKKKSKQRPSDTDESQNSKESQEGPKTPSIKEPKQEPKSPKPKTTAAEKSLVEEPKSKLKSLKTPATKETRQSMLKAGEISNETKSLSDGKPQQLSISKPITEKKQKYGESDDIDNEDMNQIGKRKQRQKSERARGQESEEENDKEENDPTSSRKRPDKKRKPGDQTGQRDRDQEFSIAIDPDEMIGDRVQRGPKKAKGPSRIKISIKPVDGESGDKAAMKGFCRLRGGGHPSQGKTETSPPHFQTRKEFIKYMKSKMTKRYSYKFGRKYPGVVIGHNHNVEVPRVPSYMGWLWNIKTLGINKLRRGWKPGAIRKPIKEMMSYFLDPYPYDTLPVSKRLKSVAPCPSNQPTEGPQRDKPTLRVQKKNGEYNITMNPLNESAAAGDSPYLPCRPIKFTLTADERGRKLAQVRDIIKVQGYDLCKCNSLSSCQCRDQAQNWMLQCELDRLTDCLQMQPPISYKDLRVSESEMDIEFTPPSVVMRPKQMKRTNNAAAETQYDQKDYLAGQTYTCLAGPMDPAQGEEANIAGVGMNKGAKTGKKGETYVMGQGKGKVGVKEREASGQQTAGKSTAATKSGIKNAQNDKSANQAVKGNKDPQTIGQQTTGKTAGSTKVGVKNAQTDKTSDQQGVSKPGAGGKAGVKNLQSDKMGDKTNKDGSKDAKGATENSNARKGDAGKFKPAGK